MTAASPLLAVLYGLLTLAIYFVILGLFGVPVAALALAGFAGLAARAWAGTAEEDRGA